MTARYKGMFHWMVLLIILAAPPLAVWGQDKAHDASNHISIAETNFSGTVGAGARAMGMGGAFIAIADDATAASWNPAGLGQLQKAAFSVAARYQDYNKRLPAQGNNTDFFGPHNISGSSIDFDFASFTFPIHLGKFKLVTQVSYQRAISYQLRSRTSDIVFRSRSNQQDPELAGISIDGEFSDFQTYNGGFDVASLSLGAEVLKGFYVGASFNYWGNGYRGVSESYFDGDFTVDGDDEQMVTISIEDYNSVDVEIKRGLNFNLGLLLELSSNLKIGAVYKSGFNGKVDYEIEWAEYTDYGGAFPSQAVSLKSDESATLKWPQTWGVGVSYRPIDPLTLSLDFTYTAWSKSIFKDLKVFETTADTYFPTFEPVYGTDENGNPTDQKNVFSAQHDAHQVRFGMEYLLISDKVLIPIRIGCFSDSQYYPEASGEKINFFGLTGGFGIKTGGLGIDFAVVYETGSYIQNRHDYAETRFSDIRSYMSAYYRFK